MSASIQGALVPCPYYTDCFAGISSYNPHNHSTHYYSHFVDVEAERQELNSSSKATRLVTGKAGIYIPAAWL